MDAILILLIISIIANLLLIVVILKSNNKKQLKNVFLLNMIFLLICTCGQCAQIIFGNKLGVKLIYYDYFVYIGTCFLPVSVFFTGLIYAKTRIKFKKRYLLLLVIPILSLIILWTNDFHHLFYEEYSTDISKTIYGPYMIIHNMYSYILLIIGILYMLIFSIKNSGVFSKQSILIVIGISIPVITNILGTFQIIPMSIYITPITFTITVIFCAISIFKFQFLGVTPIAMQKIVDRISDSFVVLDESNRIIDFNQTFIKTFNIKDGNLRNRNFINFLKDKKIRDEVIVEIECYIEESNSTKKTISFEKEMKVINKFFNIEITPIYSDGSFLGTLFLLKDITQHKQDIETIKRNQDILMERERLASLGQLIGGIAHNLRSPIMSIAGATEGLEELIKEYDASIDDPLVNSHDHHEIAGEMESWIPKIRTYTEYMSDIITTVKGQAVALTNEQDVEFTINELVKRVSILMKHELKNAYINFKVLMKIDENLTLIGDVNNLVQVVDNMISNSIQAYNGEKNRDIELEINKNEENVIITIRDYAGGLPKEVQEKLFKEMVTTKGKNGTGLGLYMSYSNIKAHFGGDITYKTEIGKGTEFYIIIPMKK